MRRAARRALRFQYLRSTVLRPESLPHSHSSLLARSSALIARFEVKVSHHSAAVLTGALTSHGSMLGSVAA
jgi:hypothetical protein